MDAGRERKQERKLRALPIAPTVGAFDDFNSHGRSPRLIQRFLKIISNRITNPKEPPPLLLVGAVGLSGALDASEGVVLLDHLHAIRKRIIDKNRGTATLLQDGNFGKLHKRC
jgi:hypothetical protein